MSKLPLFFFADSDKLAGTYVLSLKIFNILIITLASSEAPSRVYINEEIQDMIPIIIKTRPAAMKSLCKCFSKAHFYGIYKSDNYIACYNFCQQCKGYFAIAKAKKPTYILFAASFLLDYINFH